MSHPVQIFETGQPVRRSFSRSDLVVLLGLVVLIALGIRLALSVPLVIAGPDISLSIKALPTYASFSLGRMFAAYTLSLLFTIFYGRSAAKNHRTEQVLLPILDVLQSVPILSFLPVVLLSFSAILPENLAVEFASIVLIFTSQAWNLTFAWYQSLTTLPKELREASTIFHFNNWQRLKTLELPFAAISLIWNSVMSWAGGWFFLMAAETFTVGQRDFRLPGLGSYLQEAANQKDMQALFWGLATLVTIIILLDQLVWRPLLAWSDRFKLEMVESELPSTSWFYDLISGSHLLSWLGERFARPILEQIDRLFARRHESESALARRTDKRSIAYYLFIMIASIAMLFGIYLAAGLLFSLPLSQWVSIALGLLATFTRVVIALTIALAWTIPVGVLIGTNRRVATFLQPVVQIVASIPATALFPVFLLFLIQKTGGISLAAILLMLLGTQWYLLFNVIAGASAIPQDLKFTSTMLQINGLQRWRTLILPALFPFVITGAITASGGAWNASIVAEYVKFGGQTYAVIGIGSIIALATSRGDYPLLFAGTLTMVLAVVLINRLVWRRLYRLAESQYRLE